MAQSASVPRAGSAAPKRFLRRYGKHYAGLAPFLALFALFILYPMFYGLVMSFTDWSTKVNAKTAFVGLDNFRAVLGSGTQQGRRFLTSLGNLVWFVALVVPLNLCLATLISLVLNQFTGRLHNFLRSAYFVPYIAPFFLATGVWLWMISANTGVVSVLLAGLGIGQGVVWRLTPGYFLALMIMVDLWRAIGFNMIILTAGMKNIPEELYEASTIDGATTFQQWFRITLPMLEPVLFFVIINCFIGAIQAYDIPWVLSNSSAVGVIGGKQAFASFPVMEIIGNVYSGKAANLGRACAQGLVLMAIIFLITAAQVAYRGRRSRV